MIKLNHLSFLMLFVLLGSKTNSFGQNLPAATTIVPLSPNAAELNKYASIPVNTMTGVPSISFPLCEVNTGKISLPISLSYHASGIKVNQKATWVGLGWSLNAGGAISRAVRGDEDEKSFGSALGWFNDPSQFLTVLDQLQEQNLTGNANERMEAYQTYENQWGAHPGHDTHPDFFGYVAGSKSGKFIYSRAQQKFVTLPFEPINITRNANNNTYRIADDNGTVYLFEAKEVSLYSVGIFPNERERVQSWFLSKIISADGTDSIMLNYEVEGYAVHLPEKVVSFSRTYKKHETDQFHTVSEITRVETDVASSLLTLKEIIFPQGKVLFFANTPRQDYRGNRLDSIVMYSNQGGNYLRVKKFGFNYDYFLPSGETNPAYGRLRLLSYNEVDIITGTPVTHAFQYNAVTLPPVGSFAADYWGFYNGAGNSSLIPNVLPLQPELQIYGPVGNAYRNASVENMMAGMLEKITYPTGGYSVFEYEPNKYQSDNPGTMPSPVTSMTVHGIGVTQVATQEVNFQYPQNALFAGHLNIVFSPYQPGFDDIPQELVLRDLTTGTTIKTWQHTGNGFVTQTINEDYAFDKTHQYRFIATVRNNTSSYISVEVTCDVTDPSTLITTGGGIRCKSIKTYDLDGSVKDHIVYKYGTNETGLGITLLPDQSLRRNFTFIKYKETKGTSVTCCAFDVGDMFTYVGNTSYPTFSFLGATVLYDEVTKYQMGGTVPNGKTVQQYKIPTDFQVLLNPRLPGGYEMMDNSLFNQQLTKETKYGYNQAANTYYPVEEQTLKYKQYNPGIESAVRIYQQMIYFVGPVCASSPTQCFGATISSDFHHAPYAIRLGCYKLDTIYQRIYDLSGNFVQTVKAIEYNNGMHLYPTGISTTNSKGQLLKTVTRYPGDHQPSDPNSSVLDRMVLLNMLQQPFWNGDYNNNALLNYVQTTFNNQWDANLNLILLEKQELLINKNTANLKDFIQYKKYDSYGNALRVTNGKGIHKSYIWDYNSQYPIAEVISKNEPAPTEIAYTSFEADGAGNWSIGSGIRISDGITGNKCYQLSDGNISRNSLNAATEYVLSYWIKDGNALSILGTQGSAVQGRSVGDWKHIQHLITGISQLTISGTGLIDELRLYPRGAQMTTYTYEPLIGMTSTCDVANKIIYYEYDGLNRLKLTRDQDKNILKTLEYKYQQNSNQ